MMEIYKQKKYTTNFYGIQNQKISQFLNKDRENTEYQDIEIKKCKYKHTISKLYNTRRSNFLNLKPKLDLNRF